MGGGGSAHACTSSDDQAELAKTDMLYSVIVQCVELHPGDDAGIAACLQTMVGVSSACAMCYAQLSDCGGKSCGSCGQPEGATCGVCVNQNCGAVLKACTGLPPTYACAGDADQVFINGTDVRGEFDSCFMSGTGSDYSCVKTATGLSDLCVDCYNDYATCVSTQCAPKCTGGLSSEGCLFCATQSCLPAFGKCSGVASANGCNPALTQLSNKGNPPTINFSGPPSLEPYSPPCVKIHAGMSVVWSGDFSLYPLAPDVAASPIMSTSTGAKVSFTFQNVGTYGFHSTASPATMLGAVFVVP
jgi:hypothetical protein